MWRPWSSLVIQRMLGRSAAPAMDASIPKNDPDQARDATIHGERPRLGGGGRGWAIDSDVSGRRDVIGVGRGHLGLDREPPRRQTVAEHGRLVGVVVRQVVALAEVAPKVVEFEPAVLVILDQLAVAQPDRAAGLAALIGVVGIVPEQGVPLQHAVAPEDRDQTFAVDRGVRGGARRRRSRGRSGTDPGRSPGPRWSSRA